MSFDNSLISEYLPIISARISRRVPVCSSTIPALNRRPSHPPTTEFLNLGKALGETNLFGATMHQAFGQPDHCSSLDHCRLSSTVGTYHRHPASEHPTSPNKSFCVGQKGSCTVVVLFKWVVSTYHPTWVDENPTKLRGNL